MLKKRLLWQLFPSYLLITVAALLAVTWYTSHSLRKFYHNQVANDLQARARLVEQQILPSLKKQSFQEIDSLCKKIGPISSTRITVILPDGEVIADSDKAVSKMENHADRPEFKQAIQKGSGRSLRFSNTLGTNMMYLALPVIEQNRILAVVRTSIPATAIDRQLKDIYKKIIWAGLVVAACAAVVSLIISRRISRPVEQMKETAKRFASGQLDLRVPIPETAELADLARALNEMARQLRDRINTITRQRNESEAILSSMAEGVLAVDGQGRIVSINKAAANFLSIDPAQAQQRNVEEVIRNVEIQQFIQKTLDSRQATEMDIFLPTEDGHFFRFLGASLADCGGSRCGAVIVLNDMTRIRRLEKVRRDFVANVSHELKTPITSIKGFVETLLDGAVNEPGQARHFLEIIARHADRLNAIIEDLLNLSRLEDDDKKRKIFFEKTFLRPVLTAAVELSKLKAEEKQIKIELNCDKNIKSGINAALLEQAIANLLDNAIKYSEPGGEVKIDVRQEDKEIAVSVQDNGCGIEKKYLPRIFERFYVVDKARSRKLGGTGLGLAIVKHIAQVHSGYVTVESSSGKGSTFTIHLPAD
ncbi:MAG TPA: HAMP domain-containing protein [Phycisphaerales bacterium]|nr:HAMP domain-containing protein [Phycisphaerales bacterium]